MVKIFALLAAGAGLHLAYYRYQDRSRRRAWAVALATQIAADGYDWPEDMGAYW